MKILLFLHLSFFLFLSSSGLHGALSLDFLDFRAWQIVTFPFDVDPASSPLLLVVNLLFLLMVAGDVEQMMGTRRFVLLYITSAVAGGVGAWLFSAPKVHGSTGGVLGILLAFGVYFHNRRIFGRIPGRIYSYGLMAALMASAYAAWAIAGSPIPMAVLGYIGGPLVASLYFLARPWLQRRRIVKDLIRQAEAIQEQEATKERVDRLLEKISAQGVASLSGRERKYLEKASKRLKIDQR